MADLALKHAIAAAPIRDVSAWDRLKENYEWLWDDSVFWLSVFNTLLYTGVASVFKFAIGLYLALLLNNNMPFKSVIRALVLIPFIVPTVLSAIAFWWIFDSQFSIVSW